MCVKGANRNNSHILIKPNAPAVVEKWRKIRNEIDCHLLILMSIVLLRLTVD